MPSAYRFKELYAFQSPIHREALLDLPDVVFTNERNSVFQSPIHREALLDPQPEEVCAVVGIEFQSPIHREALLDFRPSRGGKKQPQVSIPYSSGSPLRLETEKQE